MLVGARARLPHSLLNVTVRRVCIDLFHFPHTILCVRQINNNTFDHYVEYTERQAEGRAFRD